VFENRVLRRIFETKRAEAMGGRKKLYNEELRDSYSLPSIIGIIKFGMRWTEHEAQMRENRKAYRLLVIRPEEKMWMGRKC
jgi:hypothetical protein